MSRRTTAFLSFFILLAGAIPVLGQGRGYSRPTYSISGTVRDNSDQRTMEAVRVDLLRSTGEPISTTFTRGNGEFEFNNLANGEYTIQIRLKGYQDYQQKVILFNTPRQNVSVFLSRPVIVAQKNSGNAISVHQLSAPHKARDEFQKGLRQFYGKSDPRGAISHFQRAIKEYPDYYEAYAQLGGAYAAMGDVNKGESALKKSIQLSSSKYPDAFFLLAGVLNNAERYADADPVAQKGIALDATSWRGYFELARAQMGEKLPQKAEKNVQQARNLNPKDPQIYLLMANIHIESHDYVSLLQDLNGYLKLDPKGPQAEQARQTRDKLKAALKKAKEKAQSTPGPSNTNDQQ